MVEYCPCRECNERQIYCHSSCEKYKKYRNEIEQEKELAQKQKYVRSLNKELFDNHYYKYKKRSNL